MEDQTEHERTGDRIVNVRAKKTELEWSYATQAFIEKTTHTWFTWMNWLLATGAMQYLANKTHSALFSATEFVCYTLMSFYFLFFFVSLRVEPFHSWLFDKEIETRGRAILRLVLIVAYGGLVVALSIGARIAIGHAIDFLGKASPSASG